MSITRGRARNQSENTFLLHILTKTEVLCLSVIVNTDKKDFS